MTLERHKEDWERLAETDALWAVLTAPNRRGGGWDEEAFFATGETEIAHVLGVVDALGRPLGRSAALDFGSGVGRLTRALARRFDRAVGVDISEVMVASASRLDNGTGACEFRVNTTADLAQFETASFDFVYSSIVLQHLPSAEAIEAYVGEFLRVAKADGLVVFGAATRIAPLYALQPRRRLYALLRRVGVHEQWMLRRTPLTPMRMTAVPEDRLLALLHARGGELLHSEPLTTGPVRTTRYYVAPSDR
jgi:SAM-dependent methyltransferase